MARPLLIRVCVLFVSIAVFFSCRTEQENVQPGQPDMPVEARDIDISEAQTWMNSKAAGARIDGTTRAKRSEYWSAAKKQNYRNGLSVISVPLTYNYNRDIALKRGQFAPKNNTENKAAFIDHKLLIYKDKHGQITADVLRILPSDEYRKTHTTVNASDFDGMVLAYDASESNFMGGWYYKNGQPTGRVGLKKSKNARVPADCDILVYTGVVGSEGPPARVSTGDPNGGSPDNGFWSQGVYYQLAYTIPLDCGGAINPGNSVPPNTDTGIPDWAWNTAPTPSGGGSSILIAPSSPYTPAQLTADLVAAMSPTDAFFYSMEHNNIPSIVFDDDEKAVIREYPQLISSLSESITQYGRKPDGSNAFVLSAADQAQYPKFTELVRSLPSFVDQHPRVKQALSKHTNLPWSKIKPMLKFGNGPKLVLNELPNDLGHTVYPAYPEAFIEINARYVRGLETANLEGTKEATAFLLTVTILHELTHYGAVDGNRGESSVDEFGNDFEREILGTLIDKNNAGQLMVIFKKLN